MALLLAVAALQAAGDVAGRLNDEIITWDEVYKELGPRVKRDNSDAYRELLNAQLKQMIEKRLILQEAKKLGIKVDERDVDKRLEEEKLRLVDEERFRMFLHYRKRTHKEFREDLRQEILEAQLIQYKYREWISPDERTRAPDSVVPAINEIVSPMERKAYYVANREQFSAVEEGRVGTLVLVFQSQEERERKLKLAKSLKRRLEEHADFLATAYLYHEGPRQDGAIVAPMGRDTPYGPEVAEMIFEKMNEGDVSPVVERPGRFILFYLAELKRQEPKSLGDASPIINSILVNQRRVENRQRLIQALLKRAYVEPGWLFEGSAR
jgi:peptidyl-prolyl cis-trans isomerase SurA